MRVLVACEESQTVAKAFYDLGHDAYSCDLIEASGDIPERHIQGDALAIAKLKNWDLIIAHPPCQYLANSGVKHLDLSCQRWRELFKAADFFRSFLDLDCPRICVENPIPHKYGVRLIGRKYDQLIQPHEFGHYEKKATCLWLKGLDPLINTTNLKWQTNQLSKSEGQRNYWQSPSAERTKNRSKTYEGIAKRMAYQWGSETQTRLFM